MTPTELQRDIAERNLKLLWSIALLNIAWLIGLTMVGLFVTIRVGETMHRIQDLESHAGRQDLAIKALANALVNQPPAKTQQHSSPNQLSPEKR